MHDGGAYVDKRLFVKMGFASGYSCGGWGRVEVVGLMMWGVVEVEAGGERAGNGRGLGSKRDGRFLRGPEG